jgi:hypothetical protein
MPPWPSSIKMGREVLQSVPIADAALIQCPTHASIISLVGWVLEPIYCVHRMTIIDERSLVLLEQAIFRGPKNYLVQRKTAFTVMDFIIAASPEVFWKNRIIYG